jgi:hypothetical protein
MFRKSAASRWPIYTGDWKFKVRWEMYILPNPRFYVNLRKKLDIFGVWQRLWRHRDYDCKKGTVAVKTGCMGTLYYVCAYVKDFCKWNYGNGVPLQVEDGWQAFPKFNILLTARESPDSIDRIATGYGLDGRRVGVRVQVRARFLSSLRRPDWFWGPLNLLSNG